MLKQNFTQKAHFIFQLNSTFLPMPILARGANEAARFVKKTFIPCYAQIQTDDLSLAMVGQMKIEKKCKRQKNILR